MISLFDEILANWRVEWDGKIPGDQRVEALLDLFASFQKYGLDKHALVGTNIDKIIAVCTNERSAKYKTWVKIVRQDIETAIVKTWPLEMANFDPNKAKQVVLQKGETEEVAPRPIDEEETIPPNQDPDRVGRDIDPAVLARQPKPQVIYDPAISEFLGFDNE